MYIVTVKGRYQKKWQFRLAYCGQQTNAIKEVLESQGYTVEISTEMPLFNPLNVLREILPNLY